jgi:hypothetical protein
MKFKSKKSIGAILIFSVMVAMITFIGLAPLLLAEQHTPKSIIMDSIIALVLLGIAGIFLWMLHGTYYILKDGQMFYASGPMKGSLPLSSITEIVKGKTKWSGIKPALATKGLIIKYNRYDEIYISPESNDAFIAEILKLNNAIVITA